MSVDVMIYTGLGILFFFIGMLVYHQQDKKKTKGQEVPLKTGRILFVLLFGMFVAILNQTSLNTALPVIMNDLHIKPTTVQWLTTGFMLVNGILIPISAFLIGRFGFRKLFLTAMISFTIGSVVCAMSNSFDWLMTGRVIQAIGAGILMPLGMNVFMTVFPPEKRGAAMGTMGIAMILGPAIGPTLSGWIVQNYEWNLMFDLMVVIGIVDVIMAFFWFRLPSKIEKGAIDFIGILFSSIGFGSLLYGFSEAGSKGWDSKVVLLGLAIGVVFIGLFAWRQATAKNPLLDLKVLRYKAFTFTVIINGLITMSLFGAMLLLPIFLQQIRGFTPLQSGLLLLPGALVMGIMGPLAGKFFDRFGIKILAVVGLAITTFATWEFTNLSEETTYRTILGLYTIRSFGMSMLMMPIMTAGMNALPQYLISHGTALSNTIRQVAGSIGTALLVTIMTMQTTNFLEDAPKHAGVVPTPDMVAAQVKEATIHGINDAFWFATIISCLALVLALFLQNKPQNKEKK